MSEYAIQWADKPIRLRREADDSFTLYRGQQAMLLGLTRDEAHAVLRSQGGRMEHGADETQRVSGGRRTAERPEKG